MVTTGNIIKSALKKIGVLDAGEPLEDQEGIDGLETLHQMVDAWSNESLLIPISNVLRLPLIAGQSQYTIGKYVKACAKDPVPDNHLETAQPLKIESALIRDSEQTDYPQRQMSLSIYNSLSRKGNESRPSRFYVRNGWPLMTIEFESSPYNNETFIFQALQPLSEVLNTTDLTAEVNLPEGYQRALIYSLAVELSPDYGKTPDRVVLGIANRARSYIKRNNKKMLVLSTDAGVSTQRKGLGTYIIEQGP